MPDHLQDPCATCHLECADGLCVDPKGGEGPYYQDDCTDYAAYAARRDLLERLKGEGIKTTKKEWAESAWMLRHRASGPGWLVWIPEGE